MALHFPVYLKEMKLVYKKGNCSPTIIAVLVTIAETWNQPLCSWMDEQIRKCGMHTQWNIIQL